MLNWFSRSTGSMLGIDITSAVVKVLELSLSDGQYRVESYAVSPLPDGAVVEKNIKNIEAVTESVQKAIDRANSSTVNAAVAVADSSVITKRVQFDNKVKSDELETLVQLEADKFIPYSLDEVNLDFTILGPSSRDIHMNDVLIVASRAENVSNRVAAVEGTGLSVNIVDVESYASERACLLLNHNLPEQSEESTIAVVDIGARMTSLMVMKNLSTIFTREEIFGGMQLTEQIQTRYGLSYSEAGRAKKNGSLPEDYEIEVLMPFKESAVLQVRRSLQFFFSTNQHSKVDYLLLAGGTVQIPGIAEMMEEQLGIPTSIANPFAHMQVAEKINLTSLSADAPAMMTSCGLAMRALVGQG